ncbi:hypothetical protein Ciccas_011246, partial [Cichlidogyrus casuarinus]
MAERWDTDPHISCFGQRCGTNALCDEIKQSCACQEGLTGYPWRECYPISANASASMLDLASNSANDYSYDDYYNSPPKDQNSECGNVKCGKNTYCFENIYCMCKEGYQGELTYQGADCHKIEGLPSSNISIQTNCADDMDCINPQICDTYLSRCVFPDSPRNDNEGATVSCSTDLECENYYRNYRYRCDSYMNKCVPAVYNSTTSQECYTDSECTSLSGDPNQICENYRCISRPIREELDCGGYQCAPNAECRNNYCYCKPGFVGDAFRNGCERENKPSGSISFEYQPSMILLDCGGYTCAANAKCDRERC